MAQQLTQSDIEQAQKWGAAAFAFLDLRLNDEEFDNSLPDRVYLHPMSEFDPGMAPLRRDGSESGFTDVYISIDNPRDFKIGASPAEPE